MKNKKLLFMSIVTTLAVTLTAGGWSTRQSDSVESAREVQNLKSQLEQQVKEFEELKAVFDPCIEELSIQAWGFNFLYCDQLKFPILRTVAEKNWSLVNEAGILNFIRQDAKQLEVSPYCNVTSVCYLLADRKIIEENQVPSSSNWVEITANSDGKYLVPWNSSEVVVIKYSVKPENTDIVWTFYGVLANTP